MRLPTTLTFFLTAATALPSTAPEPLSIQMAKSIISRNEGIYNATLDASGSLQAGFVQKSFTKILAQYPNHPSAAELATYMTQSSDSLLSIFANSTSAGRYPMDRLSSGNNFIALAHETGQEKYKRAVEVLKQSIDANKRNAQGGLWYYVYPNWSYLDGMFSFGPFWALYTSTYDAGNATAWQELERQFGLVAAHCAFRDTELLVHGYDDSRTAVWANNSRGQSPHVWGRSLGWYVKGLLDTLTVMDEGGSWGDSAEVQRIRDGFVREFRTRMHGIARAADPETGAWWQVLDQPGREGNYIESSGSAMFAYALLAGVRKGYLDMGNSSSSYLTANGADYVEIGRRAHAYLEKTFVVDNGNGTLGWDGTVSVCSLNSTASYEYYVGQPIRYDSVLGSAAFVEASLEVERLDG